MDIPCIGAASVAIFKKSSQIDFEFFGSLLKFLELKMMTRKLYLFMMIFCSTASYAEWLPLATSPKGDIKIYSDPASKIQSGKTIKINLLVDYKNTQGRNTPFPHRSTVSQDEFDCLGMRKRMLSISSFSENMGRGSIVSTTNTPTQWTSVGRSNGPTIDFDFACKR